MSRKMRLVALAIDGQRHHAETERDIEVLHSTVLAIAESLRGCRDFDRDEFIRDCGFVERPRRKVVSTQFDVV